MLLQHPANIGSIYVVTYPTTPLSLAPWHRVHLTHTYQAGDSRSDIGREKAATVYAHASSDFVYHFVGIFAGIIGQPRSWPKGHMATQHRTTFCGVVSCIIFARIKLDLVASVTR